MTDNPENTTRMLRRSAPEKKNPDAPKTTVYRPPSESNESEDLEPVTGWLVAVSGSRRGKSFPLHYGVNIIGRAADCAVCLDVNDSEIARENQAEVIYDGRGRKFYLRHGHGKNLTYLNEDPVLEPREIKHGDEIKMGKTVLQLVPFCGADFDWEDLS
ncbi:FHA domain-containing protein [Candidatus Spongiihabitans sp.]|uniref:FHA domain-containing protein n=1 Tax=Candidatus Spongiihabitans sp. TaxID=3101308 RepID=UPI003C7E3076